MSWLPQDVILRLNVYEAGWLAGILRLTYNDAPQNKRGPNDEIVPSTIRDCLLEKLNAAVEARDGKETPPVGSKS